MKENEKIQEELIKFAEILNNYEQGNYKLDDEEFEFIKNFTKKRIDNLELAKEIDQIKDMSRTDRKKYIENCKKIQEAENSNKTTTQEIADTFDVGENSINEEKLKDGKTLYVVYSNKLGRNVVLEDGAKNESLIEELQDIKEEKMSDPDSIIEGDYTDVIDDKVLKQDLELSFVPVNQLNDYVSFIEKLSQEKLNELDCLVKNAADLGIEYINLENVVGIDKDGKIYEAYYDVASNDYKVSGTGDDIKENVKEEEEDNLNNRLYQNEIDSMFVENEEELDDDKKLVEEEEKQLKKEFRSPNNYYINEE